MALLHVKRFQNKYRSIAIQLQIAGISSEQLAYYTSS